MKDDSHKEEIWSSYAQNLGITQYEYTEDTATWFFEVLSTETLLDIGADLEETADEICDGFKAKLDGVMDRELRKELSCSTRTDGKSLGLSLNIRHKDIDCHVWAEFVDVLAGAVSEYME